MLPLFKEKWFPQVLWGILSSLFILNVWFVGRLIASIDDNSGKVAVLVSDVRVLQAQMDMLITKGEISWLSTDLKTSKKR